MELSAMTSIPQVQLPSGTDIETQPTADVLSGPAFGFVTMPTSAQAALTTPVRGILVTSPGNLSVVMANGTSNNAAVFAVSAGAIYPFRAIQLGSNNTAGVLGLN